jgi:hypothetical protein
MHRTNSGSGAVIPTQISLEQTAINSKPRAANKLSAIFRSRAMMPSTIQGPKAMNSNSDAKRIDSKRDLQIASSSNRQSINLRNRYALCLRRTLRPTFKVQENQLITNIL